MKFSTVTTRQSSPVVAIDGQNTPLQTNGRYVWKDEKASFVVKAVGGKNNPTWGTLFSGFEGLIFPTAVMTQVWVDFHIDHDIALNTKVYPHVHWMPLTQESGTVRWCFQYVIAKGHGQSVFPTTSQTITVDHRFSAGSMRMHMVTEVPEIAAIVSSEIEPDSVIKMRVYRDGGFDTYRGGVHAWQADLHYQVARVGTVNRSPNFYG